MLAATNSNKHILEMLIAKGADETARDRVKISRKNELYWHCHGIYYDLTPN